MNLLLMTTSGMKHHSDVACLVDYTDREGKEVFEIGSFNPKVDDVIIDKKDVLLIQVIK